MLLLASKPGQEWLAALNGLSLGDELELPPLMPGVSQENTLAKFTGKTGDSWQFNLLYYGVPVGEATAKIDNLQLKFEVKE